jgi:mannose-6-phosphate isomerase-like protein (cupin superfamily)
MYLIFKDMIRYKSKMDKEKESNALKMAEKAILTSMGPFQRKESATRIDKGWGYEIIFANHDLYCGKILHFYENSSGSMHFHLKKTETWYVWSGRFMLHSIDTRDASQHVIELQGGDVITNQIGQPHQLVCIEEGDIFEVSTKHMDQDSYRIGKGDSQK